MTGPGSAAAERAQTLYFKRDYSHALEQIEQAIQIEPKNRFYIGLRAAIHAAEDNVYGAIADYTEMLAIEPNDVEVYRERARLYKIMRDFGNAATDLNTAIKLAPKDAQNHAEKARLDYAQQRYQDAAKDYDTALALDPSNRQYLREQTLTYEYMKEFHRAFANCDRLVSIDPTGADGYECRADVSAVTGDKKRALDNLDEAIPRDSQNPRLYSMRGEIERQLGQWRRAHADFEQTVGMEPNDSDVCNTAAWRLATSANEEVRDGEAALKLAIRLNELTRYKDARYLQTLAAAYAETGDFDQALKWQDQAISAGESSNLSDLEKMHKIVEAFQKERAWRESASLGYEARPGKMIVLAAILLLLFAGLGLVAVLYWSARWSIRRAKRARPVAAA